MASKTPSPPQKWPFIRKRVYTSGGISWVVDGRTKNGGQQWTLGTKVEAMAKADELRVARETEGMGVFGHPELLRRGRTVQEAIHFFLDHLRREEASIPIEQAIEELLAAKTSSGTGDRYRDSVAGRLGRFAKAFSGRSVASIATKELEGFLGSLTLAPGTRNTFRRDIRTLFSYCERVGYCATDPARRTDKIKDIGSPIEILTPEQARRVLETAGPCLAYMAIGMFAGLRSAELEKLDWKDVHWEQMQIEVSAAKSKTASHRLVKIEPILAAWIRDLQALGPGFGPIIRPGSRARLDAARFRAGFRNRVGHKTADLTRPEWPSNALRHSFGSYWLATHKDAAALALQMGNSTAMIFRHYRKPIPAATAAEFWALFPATKTPAP